MIFSWSCKNQQKVVAGVNQYFFFVFASLLLLSLYDLLLPQFTIPTVLRQAHTAMLTENFVKEGFSLNGLYLNIFGNDKPVLALEFPLYNFVVGLFFLLFNTSLLWGKLLSFGSSVVCLYIVIKLANDVYGWDVAKYSGIFFVLSPLGMMMRTAFQPDAMAMMLVLISLVFLYRWHLGRSRRSIFFFSLFLLLAGLGKFPIIVPFLPLIGLAIFTQESRFKIPNIVDILIISGVFVLPFLSWYLFCGSITHPIYGYTTSERSMFFIGDLTRFFSLRYYINPVYSITLLACSGVGLLFIAFGIKKLPPTAIALLIGIPFYYILIPTVKDQHYYLFACVPIFSVLMSFGVIKISESEFNSKLKYTIYASFFIIFLFLSIYAIVLKSDKIIFAAANDVNRVTNSSDLVVSATLHNRTVLTNKNNPILFYFAKRKGWNMLLDDVSSLDETSLLKIKDHVVDKKNQGAKWIVVTWYTPDMESSVEKFIPASAKTKSDPGINGMAVYDYLRQIYPVVLERKNYAIMKL